MNTRMIIGLVLLGFVGFVAAGESSYDEVVKGMLGTIDEINKSLSGIKDEPSAIAARPDLKKHGQRMADLRKKAKELPQPNKQEKDRLELAFKGKFDESLKKLRQESTRVRAIPGGEETLKEIAILDEKKKAKE